MPRTSFKQKVALVAFGLFLGIILLEIGLRIGGFIFLYFQEQANQASLKEKGEFIVLCLGESTTQAGGAKSFPRQLEKILNHRDLGIKFTVINKGISGTCTAHIAAELPENIDRYHPDMVITMMGINDGPGTVVFEDTLAVKSRLFFERFRVYKLACLLQEHITHMIAARSSPDKSARDQADVTSLSPIISKKHSDNRAAADGELTDNHPEEIDDFLSRGDQLLLEGKLEEAGACFDQAASLNPDECYPRYVQLAQLYQRKEDNPAQAKKYYKKAIALFPDDDRAYAVGGDGLISLCREQGDWEEAEKLAQKAIGLNSNNCLAYSELARCYERKGRMAEAIEMYEKSFGLNPFHNQPFAQLTYLYNSMGRFQDIERICQRRISINPNDDKSYAALAIGHSRRGAKELTRKYFVKADKLRASLYNRSTAQNYRQLIKMLKDNKIRPVCVQYPMRKLDDLKKMIPDQEGVIFVDNEDLFKEAIEQGSYEEYFVDQFAGDFGHCTPRGNHLLAENVANTILKIYFNQPGKR